MKKRKTAILAAVMLALQMFVPADCVSAAPVRKVETLTRGLTVTGLSSGVLVNWRYLGTDAEDTEFELYRDNTLIYTSSADKPTCYKDANGSLSAQYSVKVYKSGADTASETAYTEYKLNYDSKNKNSAGYFDMELDTPTDTRLGAVYTANDASVADLDGDGKYELIIKWDPNNSQDNSKDGKTSNVIIDAYELEAGDAKRLWRIDLGQNIRAGAHYTQFMVYDLDCDGCAEMVCKTAPGSKDGAGSYVSAASSVSAIKNASDNTVSYVNDAGRILEGSEYLTLFDGKTGKALDTVYYEPARGSVSSWGDNYGNRVDRFLGGIAYLNGETPSVLMCRGYYTRSVIAAYDVVNKRLSKRWVFDSNDSGNSAYAGQGNHNLAVADVDADGYDEIVYGAMTVDHNGKGLYTTGRGHGDALHVGDFIPDRDGLEIYQVYEDEPNWGAALKDAKTGKELYYWQGTADIGRGIADNISANGRTAEFCSTVDGKVYNSSAEAVLNWSDITKWGQNSLVYWDGDLEREVLDRTMIDDYPNGRIFTGDTNTVDYNNSTKSNACISADIFGDWREEVIFRLQDGSGVRVYGTAYDTDYRLYTLMHNTQYRCGVAAENVGYNQPPHVDQWMGTGDPLPARPNVHGVLDPEELVFAYFKNNKYDFSKLAGRLTDNSEYGGAYCKITGTAANDGVNRVTFADGMAYVEDSDKGAATNLILPIPDSGNVITVSGSFKMPEAANKWTFLQLYGQKKDGTAAETVGVRTYENTYRIRTNAEKDDTKLIDTAAAVSTSVTDYKIVINKIKQKAYVTVDGKTAEIDIDCAAVTQLRVVTATGIRNIYMGSVTAEQKLLGDVNGDMRVNAADAAFLLKYIEGETVSINTALADINQDGSLDIKDCIGIAEYIK